MKILVIIILSLFRIATYSQQINSDFDGHKWEAPYALPTPKDWSIERFPIPISFAPQIPYKGVEDIRFAPGWAKAQTEEYWSYAFLWYVDGKVKIDAEIINRNIKNYYAGLIAANGRTIPVEKLIPVETSFREVRKDKDDLKTYIGTIKMLDYMAQKPITLNCKVHVKSCIGENNMFIFYELSPQPLSHNIWLSLDQLWIDFKCKKE